MRNLFLIVMLIFASYVPAFAAPLITIIVPAEAVGDVYFATTGSDTSNNCQTKASPCLTPSRAISQVISGHNIWCATGSYTMPATISSVSGGSGSPIYFGPYVGQSCTFTTAADPTAFGVTPDPTADGTRISSSNYWVIHDSTFNYSYRFFNFNQGNVSTHWQFYKNTTHQVDNTNTSYWCTHATCGFAYSGDSGDNGVDYIDYVQNTMYCDGVGDDNNGAIFHYSYPRHFNIVGNLIHDCPVGIRNKFDTAATLSSGMSGVIANNIIYNVGLSMNIETSWAIINNNVLANTLSSDQGAYSFWLQGGHDQIWQHNTFYKAGFYASTYQSDPTCKGCDVRFIANAFGPTTVGNFELNIAPYATPGGGGNERFVSSDTIWPIGGQVFRGSTQTGFASYNSTFSQGAGDIAQTSAFAGSPTGAPGTPATWQMTNPHTAVDSLPSGVIYNSLLTTDDIFASLSSPSIVNRRTFNMRVSKRTAR